MTNLPKSAISPLDIALKLAAADNGTEPHFANIIAKDPRLVELLWFLQSVSMQPGGLEKFSVQVMDNFAPQFGPGILHAENVVLTPAQRGDVWKLLPVQSKRQLIQVKSWMDEKDAPTDCEFRRYELAFRRDPRSDSYPDPLTAREQAALSAAYLKITPAQFLAAILDAARSLLPARLRSMCLDAGRWIADGPWYCSQLVEVLMEAMAAHAAAIELTLALTAVVDLTFDRLDYAWHSKSLVKIESDARTGKSESIKAWCSMYPGRGRLVSTPSSTSLRDLIMAVAEALGLPFTPNVDTADLKDRVRFIIQHSRLFLIFDEAHFLLPMNYGRNTNPARLDWVRTEIVDKGLPVALVCTPQAFKHSVERFQKWTGYNFAQFLGRIMLNVTLPNELGETDLLAVAEIQGSDIPRKYHTFIVARSMQSEGYLKAIEAICKRARYIAQRDSHPVVTLADVELSASEVIPTAPAPTRQALAARAPVSRNQPVAVKRRRVARVAASAEPEAEPFDRVAGAALPAPPRQTSPTTTPALETPARSTTLILQTT